ncbi:hypothetical protein DSECCO2_628270 [anaerobic digester metagenome]
MTHSVSHDDHFDRIMRCGIPCLPECAVINNPCGRSGKTGIVILFRQKAGQCQIGTRKGNVNKELVVNTERIRHRIVIKRMNIKRSKADISQIPVNGGVCPVWLHEFIDIVSCIVEMKRNIPCVTFRNTRLIRHQLICVS